MNLKYRTLQEGARERPCGIIHTNMRPTVSISKNHAPQKVRKDFRDFSLIQMSIQGKYADCAGPGSSC